MLADVKGAFLHGKMKREVYVELPPETGQDTSKYVGRLRRSLYGLRDAPQIWKRHLVSSMADMGFEESKTVPGVVKHKSRNVLVAIHVDDILATGLDEDLTWMSEELRKRYEVKTQKIGPEHDEMGVYLGRQIRWTAWGYEWRPSLEQVTKIVEAFGLKDAKRQTCL